MNLRYSPLKHSHWLSKLVRRKRRIASAATLGVALLASSAQAQSLELQNEFVRTGVSPNGTMGVGSNTTPGFIFDSTGTGTFNPANDYLTPGSPHAGFSLKYQGSGVLVNNNTTTSTGQIANVGGLVDSSVTSAFDQAVTWNGEMSGVLEMSNEYGLNDGAREVGISTTITALTDINDLEFSYWIDPDSGGTSSENSRGNASLGLAPEQWVNSVSETNGATLGIFSLDTDVAHNTAISPGWSTDPSDYLAGSGDTVGDHTIGIGFDIGNLLNGESITFEYGFAVAASPNDIGVSTGKFVGDTDSSWNVDANWDPEGAPSDGDPVIVDSGGASTLNHNVTGNTYTGFAFASGSAQITVQGNDINLADGANVANGSSHLQTFDVDIAGAGDLNFDGGDHGVSTQGLAIGANGTLNFNTGNSHDNVVNGPITGSGASVVVSGAGSVRLSGHNTYNGGTTVSSGRLIANSSSLHGDVVNNGTVEFDQASDGSFSGDISGTGNFVKSGSGTLNLTGNNSFTGGVSVAQGTLQTGPGSLPMSGNLDVASGATLIANLAQDVTLNGSITGDGKFEKWGTGKLHVNGNVGGSEGDVHVRNGWLYSGGTVDGQTIVYDNGRLGGTGTHQGGIEVRSGGRLAPGNSIGTINTNNFTHNAGATLQIEIDENGNSDLVNDGGVSTINGGIVEVTPDATADPSQFTVGDRYTFLTAAGGVQGAGFDSVIATGFDFPIVTLVREANRYDILLVGFNATASTYNQLQVGSWLDQSAVNGTADVQLQSLFTSLGVLGSPSAMRSAMDQLTGELYPTLAISNLQVTDNFYSLLARRLRPAYANDDPNLCGTTSAWTGAVYGEGLAGTTDGDGNARGFDIDTGGTTVILSRRVSAHSSVGCAFNFASSSLDLDSFGHTSQFENYRFSGFAQRRTASHYVTAAAHAGYDTYDSVRPIAFGTGVNGINRSATADHDGWQGGGYLELGLNGQLPRQIDFQPFIAAQFIHIDQERFFEQGAGALSLQAGGSDLDSLRTRVGANVALACLRHTRLSVETAWNHELLDDVGVINSQLAGSLGTTTFAARGVDLGRDWISVSPNAVMTLSNRVQLTGAYQLSVNDHQTFHGGSGGIVITW